MALTCWVKALYARQHHPRRAMRRCSSWRTPVRGLLTLAGRGPARGWARSRRPRARRRLWSRGAHPCLARRGRYWRGHPTAGFRATLNKSLARCASLPAAVCGVANARNSCGYCCASRLASHPHAGRAASRGLVQRRLRLKRNKVIRDLSFRTQVCVSGTQCATGRIGRRRRASGCHSCMHSRSGHPDLG